MRAVFTRWVLAAIGLALLAAVSACGASATGPASAPTPSPTNVGSPPVSASPSPTPIDEQQASAVALRMFIEGGNSTCSRQDLSSCPVTPRLLARITLLNDEPSGCHAMYTDPVMPWGMAFTSLPSVAVESVDSTPLAATVHTVLTGSGGSSIKIDFVVVSVGGHPLVDDIVYVAYPTGSSPLSVYDAHWNCH